MKLGRAIAEILKREGVETIYGYPVNFVHEYCAEVGIRPVIARSERVGANMADAVSRTTSGQTIGVFFTQHGPGVENALGAIAQAYGESVPILVLPGGYGRQEALVEPNFSALLSLRGFAKSVETIVDASQLTAIFRRAFSKLRNGRGGPVVVEIPSDMWTHDVPEPLDYEPVYAARYAPAASDIAKAVDLLLEAQRPLLHVGQGVHYAGAWPQLRRLAEHLGLPVMTTLQGKSAFPEDHPLSAGTGGIAVPKSVHDLLADADLVFGLGCSFTSSSFACKIPNGRRIVHATLDPNHLNKDIAADVGLVGDVGLTLDALIAEVERREPRQRDWTPAADRIAASKAEWIAEWMPRLTSDETPLSPYRVIWEMIHTLDVPNTIITHDAGSPRDQLAPFWPSTTPLSYIGWGKTTQLGYGLGLAMGARMAHPDKLCVNLWGDAAIGFTFMDFETAVRERIPILSIVLNNFSMAMELDLMSASDDRYDTTDISGDYAAVATALGGYGERVLDPSEIGPALRRAVAKVEAGVPVLLEFITAKETATSRYGSSAVYPIPKYIDAPSAPNG